MELPRYTPHRDRVIRINSATTAIRAVLLLDLYEAHRKELLSVCIWKITEADGKAKVRFWSEGAILEPRGSKLHHEHVNERRSLIRRLLDGEDVDTVVHDAIACMVTVEEHRRLEQSKRQGWARYRDAGIRVYDSREAEWME